MKIYAAALEKWTPSFFHSPWITVTLESSYFSGDSIAFTYFDRLLRVSHDSLQTHCRVLFKDRRVVRGGVGNALQAGYSAIEMFSECQVYRLVVWVMNVSGGCVVVRCLTLKMRATLKHFASPHMLSSSSIMISNLWREIGAWIRARQSGTFFSPCKMPHYPRTWTALSSSKLIVLINWYPVFGRIGAIVFISCFTFTSDSGINAEITEKGRFVIVQFSSRYSRCINLIFWLLPKSPPLNRPSQTFFSRYLWILQMRWAVGDDCCVTLR